MQEKIDVANREDLLILLKAFYQKVLHDDLISPFFIDVMDVDFDEHIPRIADFWETVLLNGNAYRANVVAVHLEINRLSPMEEGHFTRWLQLFTETIDNLFAGEVAETAKQRALSIATIMRIKLANASPINIKS